MKKIFCLLLTLALMLASAAMAETTGGNVDLLRIGTTRSLGTAATMS